MALFRLFLVRFHTPATNVFFSCLRRLVKIFGWNTFFSGPLVLDWCSERFVIIQKVFGRRWWHMLFLILLFTVDFHRLHGGFGRNNTLSTCDLFRTIWLVIDNSDQILINFQWCFENLEFK